MADELQPAPPAEDDYPGVDRRQEDRRRGSRGLGGRRSYGRRAGDRRQLLRDMAALVFALCGGLAVVYVFFAAFGAIDVGQALIASSVVLVLGVIWLLGFGYRMRTQASRATQVDRDRHGF